MQPQPPIDISKSKLVKCECGNPFFQQVIVFREVSAKTIGHIENVQQPVSVMICMECKKPHLTAAPYLLEGQLEESETLAIEIDNKNNIN